MSVDDAGVHSSSSRHHKHHLVHHNPELEAEHHFHHHRSASTYVKSSSSSSSSGLERSAHKNGSLHIKRPTSASQASQQLGRSNSNPQKQRPSSSHTASAVPTPTSSTPTAESPPGSVGSGSGSGRRRRRTENQAEAVVDAATFDMKLMQQAVEGLPEADLPAPSPPSNDTKKERYRSLWGKVGKHATVANTSGASTPSESSSGKKRWDQVLNPLLQKSDKKHLSRKTSQMDMPTVVAAAYLQQPEMQQQEINYMNAPNQSTTQCDCGDDSCQFCNLLLNMEMTDPNMLM